MCSRMGVGTLELAVALLTTWTLKRSCCKFIAFAAGRASVFDGRPESNRRRMCPGMGPAESVLARKLFGHFRATHGFAPGVGSRAEANHS